MSDSEWASKTAKNFQRVLDEKSKKDAVFLEEQRIRRSNIDDLWAKLRTAFYSKSASLNHEMNRQILGLDASESPDKFFVTRHEPKTAHLEVTCSHDTHQIKLVFSKTKIVDLGISIDKESGKAWLSTAHQGMKEPEEIAEWLIEELLKFEA